MKSETGSSLEDALSKVLVGDWTWYVWGNLWYDLSWFLDSHDTFPLFCFLSRSFCSVIIRLSFCPFQPGPVWLHSFPLKFSLTLVWPRDNHIKYWRNDYTGDRTLQLWILVQVTEMCNSRSYFWSWLTVGRNHTPPESQLSWIHHSKRGDINYWVEHLQPLVVCTTTIWVTFQ